MWPGEQAKNNRMAVQVEHHVREKNFFTMANRDFDSAAAYSVYRHFGIASLWAGTFMDL